MTKKLIHVLIVIFIILAAAVSYLAAITLPVKINAIVIGEIEKALSKKVFIGSTRFNISSGLVLEDLVIYDRNSIIIWAKSVSCGAPISLLFDRRISLGAVTINSPAIYLERRSDDSFNIAELVSANYKPNMAEAAALSRIIIKNARVIFIDRTLDPVFKERIDDLSMDIKLSLPDKIALILHCSIPAKSPIHFKFSGVYSTRLEELAGRLGVENLDPNEFKDYYKAAGISFTQGAIDADADLRVKDDTVELNIDGKIKDLIISKDKLKVRLESIVKMMAQYALKDKAIEYAGKLDVRRMDLGGIEALGTLENIKADIEFNDSRMWSENIFADAYGMKWKARVNILNFASPIVDIYAGSEAHLSVIQKMLGTEFGIKLPTDIAGKAGIKLAVHTEADKPLKLDGHITLTGAVISLGSGNFPIEGVTGEVQFNLEGAKWNGIELKYRGTPYVSSGSLLNFADPKIELKAASRDLDFRSAFSVHDKVVGFSELEGRYFSSLFSASGEIDLTDPKIPIADIKGTLELALEDLKKMVDNSAGLRKMKLAGKVLAEFSLTGGTGDLKRCAIRAKVKSAYVSIYGMKLTEAMVDYIQAEGLGQIKSIRALFYGGSLYSSGKIDWMARALPYSFNVDAKDVKLGKLKMDTGFKDKDVSGNIKALASLSGTFKDISRLSGAGRISITSGRLWQLNLFKGVGSIIFSTDFSNIVFTEGSCDMKFVNRILTINNFVLKSELLNLYGSGAVGPDKSVNAMLRPEIVESTLGSGTQEAIAAAVSSSTVIKITGTLEKPEYKTKANLADVVGGIAGALFQQ